MFTYVQEENRDQGESEAESVGDDRDVNDEAEVGSQIGRDAKPFSTKGTVVTH